MAVTTVTELWEGRRAEVDHLGHRTYIRVFQAITNNNFDDGAVVGNDPRIPQLFSVYIVPNGFDLGAICRRISPVNDPLAPYVWTVTVEYSSDVGDISRYDQNPLNRPATIRWSSAKYKKAVDQQVDGTPITTSAGEYYDPPVEIDDSRMILTVIRNEPAFDPGVAQLYTNATNADSFFGLLPAQVKCDSIEGELKSETGIYFWEVVYIFHFRTGTDTWVYQAKDEGSFYLDANKNPKKFTDVAGRSIRGALDGDGGKALPLVGQNDTQTITVTGSPTGGSFQITGGPLGASVITIAWNSHAVDVQTVINGSLPAGATCTCTGGPLPGTPIAITFTGTMAGLPQAVITVSLNSLTGGSSPTPTVAHTATGSPPTPAVYRSFVVYRVLPFAPLQIFPNA